MHRTDLDYHLPPGLIATRPVEPRDSARMMVVHTKSPEVTHAHVVDLPELLDPGDLLVSNDTAVCPARFRAQRIDSGGRVEGLFLSITDDGWEVMLKSNGKLREGQRLVLLKGDEASPHEMVLVERSGTHWLVRVATSTDPMVILDEIGLTPLPPYIIRARGHELIDDAADRAWYQTTFADPAKRLSVAAPTAGLHLTTELLDRMVDRGIPHQSVTLHVGVGTFQPVMVDRVEEHPIHSEWFSVPATTREAVRATRNVAGRVVAVGTTTVRTLESISDSLFQEEGSRRDIHGWTDLLVTPPYVFRSVDGLLTNFHLPQSTLLALVAAMIGLDRLHELYSLAIARQYRFYSYGDCMLILP